MERFMVTKIGYKENGDDNNELVVIRDRSEYESQTQDIIYEGLIEGIIFCSNTERYLKKSKIIAKRICDKIFGEEKCQK